MFLGENLVQIFISSFQKYLTSLWVICYDLTKSVVFQTFDGAVQKARNLDRAWGMTFSQTYKKSAYRKSVSAEKNKFQFSSRWVIQSWLISIPWEFSSRARLTHLIQWMKGRYFWWETKIFKLTHKRTRPNIHTGQKLVHGPEFRPRICVGGIGTGPR